SGRAPPSLRRRPSRRRRPAARAGAVPGRPLRGAAAAAGRRRARRRRTARRAAPRGRAQEGGASAPSGWRRRSGTGSRGGGTLPRSRRQENDGRELKSGAGAPDKPAGEAQGRSNVMMDQTSLQQFRADVIARKSLPTIPPVLTGIIALIDDDRAGAK